MRRFSIAMLFVSSAVVATTAQRATITGTYVEARTSEVFAGACIVNGEAGTTGREALLAWKVDHGRVGGVSLDGFAVVAAVVGDSNLSIHEIGGDVAKTRTALFVDNRATTAQQKALVSMATALSKSVVGSVVEVKAVPIQFLNEAKAISVATAGVRLVVEKSLDHDPLCGNKQWFGPLTQTQRADMGATIENAFSGRSLGDQWNDPNKRSGFFGTFAY